MLRFVVVVCLCTFGLTCFAQSHKEGPPDTIASCLGKDSCMRCFLFTPSRSDSERFTKLEPGDSCVQILRSRQLNNSLLDTEINVYAPKDMLKDVNGIQSIYLQLQQNYIGANIGSSEPVLSSQMYQHIQAEMAEDMSRRISSIESAIDKSISLLQESFQKTVASLPLTDTDTIKRLSIADEKLLTATAHTLERNKDIRSLPREKIPPRVTNDDPFVASGMTKDMLSQLIRSQIPSEHLRSEGRDLGGVLRQSGEQNSDRKFKSEQAKIKAAYSRGSINSENYARMEAQINAASTLNESTEPKAKLIAQRLLADTQSERLVAEGKTNVREVTIIDSEDNLSTVTQDATQTVPHPNLATYVTSLTYEIATGWSRTDYAIDIANAYQGIDASRRRDVAATAREMLFRSQNAFQKGELNYAKFLSELSLGMADLATTWIPVLSVGRSAYELITGRDVFSNKQLTNIELAGRVLDIATAGIGMKFAKGWDLVNRISQHIGDVPRYKQIIASAKKYAERMAKLGKSQTIPVTKLAHLADRHMHGGVDIAKGGDLTTVFFDNVDPLELFADATELIINKNDAIKLIESKSDDVIDFFVWKRDGLEDIGFGFFDGQRARDAAVLLTKDGNFVNIFPWHPKNPF